MMVKKFLVCSVVMAALLAAPAFGAIGDVWDLAVDWSTTLNPNGQWSYVNAGSGALLVADTEPWGGNPAWSASAIPQLSAPWTFLPPGGSPGFGAAPGEYVNSGGAGYAWTAAEAGTIDISGVLGGIKGWGGTNYDIQLNGAIVITGPGGFPDSGVAPPVPFNEQLAVVLGDVLTFALSAGAVGTLVLEQVIPEPMTMSLLGLGALGLLRRRRSA